MKDSINSTESKKSFLTFFVGQEMMGIEVLKVQEVTRDISMVPVALAPEFICGLINLRGQIATALGTHQLFRIPQKANATKTAVVCKIESNLFSLIVDSIGDVIEVDKSQFEKIPETLDENVKKFLSGIYKVNNQLLSVVDLDRVNNFLFEASHLNEQKLI